MYMYVYIYTHTCMFSYMFLYCFRYSHLGLGGLLIGHGLGVLTRPSGRPGHWTATGQTLQLMTGTSR